VRTQLRARLEAALAPGAQVIARVRRECVRERYPPNQVGKRMTIPWRRQPAPVQDARKAELEDPPREGSTEQRSQPRGARAMATATRRPPGERAPAPCTLQMDLAEALACGAVGFAERG